jgi:ketosteroid isomerase-like protein
VIRIVVADSGDLAYEYATGSGTITLKDGSTRKIENATIRVWQKNQGEWKLRYLSVRHIGSEPRV